MLAFLVRRILATLPVVAAVGVFVFLLLHLSPGDPAQVLAGENASPAAVEALRASLGLDRPMPVQFMDWTTRILGGDFGQSLFSGMPVSALILQRVEPSLALALLTLLVAVSLGIPLGTVAAWRAGSWIDRAVMALASVSFSVPIFVVAFGLIWLFGLQLRWFPVQGYVPLARGLGPFLSSLALPALTLATVHIALIARVTRASLVEVMHEDFIRTAQAKGASQGRILVRHALRNAAVPILTVVGMGLAMLLSGVVVTESLFNIPGIGRLVTEAILKRDYPIIQSVVLLSALLYVLLMLAIDLLYVTIDPRIRL